MKKIYTLLAIALAGNAAFAQSQRYSLYEEFTGESCPPCAATNPGLNKLLVENTGNVKKTLLVRFQTPIPNAPTGPNNLYNQSKAFETPRRAYYNVPFAPYARFNGTEIKDPSGQSNGHASFITQAIVDAAYAKMDAPMTITLQHSLIANNTQMHVTGLITATGPVSGKLKLHVMLLENDIHYKNAPGTNGEKDFTHIVRLMYPSVNGTDLAASYAVGETYNIDFTIPVPSYIFDLGKLGVAAFVQDDNTKNVHQVAYSEPVLLARDGALSDASAPVFQCDTKLATKVVLKNNGQEALTSATINYSVDGGTASTYDWTGSLASNSSVTVDIPTLTLTNGNHNIDYTLTNINGSADPNAGNNTTSAITSIQSSSAPSPYKQDFQNAIFPPANSFVNNPEGDDTWIEGTGASAGAVGSSQKSAKIIMYYAKAGERDEFFLPKMDLTSSAEQLELSYYVAHSGVSTNSVSDQLLVMLSKDCGTTWQTIDTKAGADLIGAPFTNSFYVPKASEWKQYNVDITAHKGTKEAMIKFVSVAGTGGNYLWLDNINVDAAKQSAIANSSIQNVILYPNPASLYTQVQFSLSKAANVNIEMFNILGEKVSTQNLGNQAIGEHNYKLDVNNVPSGMYTIRITAGTDVLTQSVSVVK